MKPKFIMMVGLVASGKTQKAHELSEEYDATIFSSDALREELYGDINDQTHNHELFNELHRRIKECLQSGKSAIYDATNLNYKRRMAFLAELKYIPCEKTCILMATPYEECLKRNAKRERKVPEEVIERMYKNITIPFFYEGWNYIEIHYGEEQYRGYYGDPADFIAKTMDFDQENKHHTLTLGEHSKAALYKLSCINKEQWTLGDYSMIVATILHDNGKCFCKSFYNSKGEITENATYYNHHFVGAYNSLFYDIQDDQGWVVLYVATLIQWHMQPYFWERDNNVKMHNKYRNLWGEELYDDVMELHRVDRVAH